MVNGLLPVRQHRLVRFVYLNTSQQYAKDHFQPALRNYLTENTTYITPSKLRYNDQKCLVLHWIYDTLLKII